MKSQCESILEHLNTYGSITPMEALNLYGCFRLGARVWELKARGHAIDSELIRLDNGKQVSRYFRQQPQMEIRFS